MATTLRQQLVLKRSLRHLRTWAPPVAIGVIIGAGAFLVADMFTRAPASAAPARPAEVLRIERQPEPRVSYDAPAPRREPSRVASPFSYRNCDAARAAGAAPIREGEYGYGAHMDGDGDGIACEPYYGR